nr:MAG TPA: hypothetical protein [Caudoviricetes sp.]
MPKLLTECGLLECECRHAKAHNYPEKCGQNPA